MAALAILIITKKSRYLLNSFTDVYEIWHGGAKWVSSPLNIQDGRQLPLLKPLNHHICNLLTDFD